MTDQPTTKGGNVILRRVDTPDRVAPGEGYEVEVQVRNGAQFINPLDPDSCGSSEPGYKIRVVLTVDGERWDTVGPTCHYAAALGGGDNTYTFTPRAPETSGETEVEAHVEMVDSGKETDTVSSRILVDAEESEPADDPGDNDGGGLPWTPPDGPTPNPSDPLNIGGQIDKLLLVVGLIAVAWAADSGAEVLS